MTTDSKSLQHFLQSNLSHKFTHIKREKFSPIAVPFLSSIFENIRLADEDYDNVDLVSSEIFKNEVPKGSNYKLCPEKARNHIESMKSTGQSCRFSVNGRKISIHIVHEGTQKPNFSAMFHRIYVLLNLLTRYSRQECSQSLTIYLYLTTMKKTLADCDRDCTIGEDNANTAFTFSCKRINEVYLYRKEEWFKVLCHELFHSFGLDFSEYECSEIDKEMFKIIPIKTDLRLYESYTELWGELMNIIFIVHFSSKNSNGEPMEKKIKKLELLLYQERMFSVYQSSKVLTHFGMSYDDLYTRTDNAMKSRQYFKETTPILSYYIIKNILMFHIGAFMEWCNKHNNGLLEFNKHNKENVDKFIDFIREHYKSSPLVESMDQARTWFIHQENTKRIDNGPITTLRMSLLD